MKLHLIRWNPNTSKYSQNDFDHDFKMRKYMDGLEDFTWDGLDYNKIENGDYWLITRVGTENNGIAAFGYFTDPSEFFCYGKDDLDFYMEVVVMFNRTDYDLLSSVKLKTICNEINWDNESNGYEILDVEQTEKFFPLIAEQFTENYGPTLFYNYSTDNHPDIDYEMKKWCKELAPSYCLKIKECHYEKTDKDNEPYVSQDYSISRTGEMILKSIIGKTIISYSLASKNEKNIQIKLHIDKDFAIIIQNLRYGTYCYAIPSFVIIPEEFEQIFDRSGFDFDGNQISESISDIKIYSHKYMVESKYSKSQIIIDAKIVFELKNSEIIVRRISYDSKNLDFEIIQKGKEHKLYPYAASFHLDEDEKLLSTECVVRSLLTGKSEKVMERKYI